MLATKTATQVKEDPTQVPGQVKSFQFQGGIISIHRRHKMTADGCLGADVN